MKHWQFFFRLWKEHPWAALWMVFLTAVSTSVFLGYPLFFRYLVDTLNLKIENSSSWELDAFRTKILLILLCVGLGQFLAGLYPFFRARMNLTFEKKLREKYFAYLLNKEQHFFQSHRTGDLITRLTDDLTNFPKISWFSCSGLFRAFNSASILFFCIITLFLINAKLAALSLLPLPVVILVYLKLSSRLRSAYDTNQKAVSSTNNHMEATLSGIRILKSMNLERAESSRFEEVLKDRKDVEMETVKLSGKIQIFYEFVNYFSQALVVGAGGYMVLQNELSLGDYYAFFSYLGMVVYPMLDIPNLLVTSRQAFVCVDRLQELEGEDSEELSSSKRVKIDDIELQSCSYKYPGRSSNQREWALQDISVKIQKGERLAIVGQIGAGKSTLLKIITGALAPSDGKLYVNSKPISQWDLSSFRNELGYIAQEPLVFSQTISSNIKFYRGGSDEEMETSSQISQFHRDVEQFENRYEQELGQRGINISGGQKQRLTIARALMGKPSVLVMDDITASLDAQNEEEFWNQAREHLGESMILIVTHRLATARRADKVMVLRDGKVECFGKLEDLLAQYGSFSDLIGEKEQDSFS